MSRPKYTEPQGEDFTDLDAEIWINGEKLNLDEEEAADDVTDDQTRRS